MAWRASARRWRGGQHLAGPTSSPLLRDSRDDFRMPALTFDDDDDLCGIEAIVSPITLDGGQGPATPPRFSSTRLFGHNAPVHPYTHATFPP